MLPVKPCLNHIFFSFVPHFHSIGPLDVIFTAYVLKTASVRFCSGFRKPELSWKLKSSCLGLEKSWDILFCAKSHWKRHRILSYDFTGLDLFEAEVSCRIHHRKLSTSSAWSHMLHCRSTKKEIILGMIDVVADKDMEKSWNFFSGGLCEPCCTCLDTVL